MSDVQSMKLSLIFAGFSLVLAAASGCASPPAEHADGEAETTESALGEGVTLTFGADYSETVQGSLEKGKTLTVAYDAARLTACRGDQNGHAAWSITGYYRLAGGAVKTFEAGGFSPSGGTQKPTIALDATGDLEVWFQNTSVWGCSAYDSDFGNNYHFTVKPASPPANAPGWIGDARSVLSRQTCGGPCDGDMQPVSGPIVYDTWVRQRAAIRALYFQVWKSGTTDFDNPNLWKALDVQVHSRVGSAGPFKTAYVGFDRRLGNNARYALDLTSLDPLPGYVITTASDCPPLERIGGGPGGAPSYVQATVELYFTVNGVELRPAGPSSVFQVRYVNYAEPYALCE